MQTIPPKQQDEVSVKELVFRFRSIFSYLLSKWLVILIVGLAGAGLGITYAFLQPVKYMYRLSFVAEDQKSGMGGLAAIAGQFGFDLGGAASGGVFSGDNVLLFLKSENLCRESLLTNYDSAGTQLLADKYAEVYELKKSWAKEKGIGPVDFSLYKNGKLPRLQDSLVQIIVQRILKKDLDVSKPDKKASFVVVSATMRDELLSKFFCERLVKIATDKFIESKTRTMAINVAKLQYRADSLGALLNSSTYTAAAAQQMLVDLNPALRSASVNAEISSRNKTMIGTIFAEVVKNLEIAKVALSQITPNVQMVDQSSLPLKKEKTSKLISLIVGGMLAGIICITFLLLRRWWRLQLSNES